MNKVAFKALEYAKSLCANDSGGHDPGHIERVFGTAVRLAEAESADVSVCALAAALHDVDDRKLSPETCECNGNARRFLAAAGVSEKDTERIIHIIKQVSFKGTDSCVPDSLEGKIVQDADRLDAVGAVGIARCFAYGGSKGRKIYDGNEQPLTDCGEKEYYASESSSINHFYEKLLLLKDMMNTRAAKHEAQIRHEYMLGFLREFYRELGKNE